MLRAGLCDFDALDLNSLASPLQRWFGSENRWKKKWHVLTVLHAFGYAPLSDLRAALVPSRDLANAAKQFYAQLHDREWIGYRELADSVSWGERGSLRHLVEWTTRLAASAYKPDSDADLLDPSEIEQLLGGHAEFVFDPRPKFRLSPNRAWWRTIDGPDGDLLKEELEQDADESIEARRKLLEGIRDTLRDKPHRSFVGTDEMDNWATHIDYDAVRAMRANGTRTVQNLYEQVVRPALLEGSSVDETDEEAIAEYLGGSHSMEKGVRGVVGFRWLSKDPDAHPECVPHLCSFLPIPLWKRPS